MRFDFHRHGRRRGDPANEYRRRLPLLDAVDDEECAMEVYGGNVQTKVAAERIARFIGTPQVGDMTLSSGGCFWLRLGRRFCKCLKEPVLFPKTLAGFRIDPKELPRIERITIYGGI